MTNQPSNPHDSFFRNLFGRREVVADFLQNYLPPSVLNHINLEELYFEPTSYVDERLKDSYSDILVRTFLKDSYRREGTDP